MASLIESVTGSPLFETGGSVMVIIAILSVCLWWLILDHYRFMVRDLPRYSEVLYESWQQRPQGERITVQRLRNSLLEHHALLAAGPLGIIEVLLAVLPMVGLLGTVIGMIEIFEVMTQFGSGNARGMASGISQALLTTMAGLMTALSGLYFAGDLRVRAERATEALSSRFESASS